MSAELTSEEMQGWARKLKVWHEAVEEYGIDEAFDVALEAAEQGWDFPPLQRILLEGVTDREEPELEAPVWDGELVRARLNVLERQAESIMDGGKAQYYDAAARWLGKARNAYRAAGRGKEWQEYLGELLVQHGRKHKLVPMLRALR